jgi:pyruvate,water dikinase
MTAKDKKFIMWFDEIGIEDIPYVGGKNASLGEMYQNLKKKGVKFLMFCNYCFYKIYS